MDCYLAGSRTEYNLNYRIKDESMGMESNSCGEEMLTDIGGNMKEGERLANLGIEGVIILKCILKK